MSEQIILIADSGSTKTDWVMVRASDGSRAEEAHTQGINPVHQQEEDIHRILHDELMAQWPDTPQPTAVYFYGAGVTSVHTAMMQRLLKEVFPAAMAEVENDMIGATRALCGRQEGIAAILGTGANSCLYDGVNIVAHTPALGYILGDEGSGASIGKRLVNAIYKREIQDSYRQMFERECMHSYDDVIYGVYRNESPSQFLASLVPFISDHIGDNIFRNIVLTEFDLFFNRNIIRLNRPKTYGIGFVGSIASTFAEILKDAARFHGLSIYSIIQRPINRLAEYHNEIKKQ